MVAASAAGAGPSATTGAGLRIPTVSGDTAGAFMRFDSPKSSTFTRPSGISIRFEHLMSRCTKPALCANSSAAPTWRTSPRASAAGSLPRRASRWEKVSPSTSSITRMVWPSYSSTSCTVTMPAWTSALAARASRSMRARASGWPSTALGNTLIATGRSSDSSKARNTSPMPPTPRRSSMR